MADNTNPFCSVIENIENENDSNKRNANCITFDDNATFDSGVCSDAELLNDNQNITCATASSSDSEVCIDHSETIVEKIISTELNPNLNILDKSSICSNITDNIPNENIAVKNNLLNLIDADLSAHGEIFSDFPAAENLNQFKEDEFQDAVQFFQDPSSISFLENLGSSKETVESDVARSSLYVTFDPLHEKFTKQCLNKINKLNFIVETSQESDVIVEHEENEGELKEKIEEVGKEISFIKKEDMINKPLVDLAVRESTGNILISFDSPVAKNQTSSVPNSDHPVKVYSEEELQQHLKMQELSLQEGFLIKQRELEQESSKRHENMDQQKNEMTKLCVSFHASLTEILSIASSFTEKIKILEVEKSGLEIENKKLKLDIKVSTEDFLNLESTFSDFHKRYEQSKNMLKVYKENEDCLKQQVLSIQQELQEKEKMCQLLQSRTEEMLQKANAELVNAKKASEAQAAVLKAQLKKAELKISSLESDYKQIKIENSKLGGICDDLMAKVSET